MGLRWSASEMYDRGQAWRRQVVQADKVWGTRQTWPAPKICTFERSINSNECLGDKMSELTYNSSSLVHNERES